MKGLIKEIRSTKGQIIASKEEVLSLCDHIEALEKENEQLRKRDDQWRVKYEQAHELWNIDNCRNNDEKQVLLDAVKWVAGLPLTEEMDLPTQWAVDYETDYNGIVKDARETLAKFK